jgi:DNA-binding NtrC family response regulator
VINKTAGQWFGVSGQSLLPFASDPFFCRDIAMDKENYRILIVDDERSMLLLLRRVVESEGYTVQSASDGKEALLIAGKYKPHMIITDLVMPEMGGMEMMEKYRELDSETDFIVLTAYGTVESAVTSIKMGAIAYILKPLKGPAELRRNIERAFINKFQITSIKLQTNNKTQNTNHK